VFCWAAACCLVVDPARRCAKPIHETETKDRSQTLRQSAGRSMAMMRAKPFAPPAISGADRVPIWRIGAARTGWVLA